MRAALFAVFVLMLSSGCGEEPTPPSRPAPEVALELVSPGDAVVVRDETVEIQGTVRPARAQVQVLGREVAVDGGAFATRVALEPGANLIDVAASARGRRPAFAVTRVVREQRVPVPDVIGRDADTVQDQLEGLGLIVRLENAGGFFDPLLPGDPKVCESEPAKGEQVLPGSEVTLLVAREC